MIRSFAFDTQGKLHSQNIATAQLPTLLADPGLFLWVDLDKPSPAEWKEVLEHIFQFHPLSIEDCVQPSPMPKVEEYTPKDGDHFTPYLFMVIHAVDYSRQDGCFGTSELDFFLGKNFLVTYHEKPLRSVASVVERALNGTFGIARAPDRVAHSLLDALVDNYKPALEELGLEIGELEQQALQKPSKETLNQILQVKKEVQHLRRIIGPQLAVLYRFAQGEFKEVRPKLVPYFRDVYDHVFRVNEAISAMREMLAAAINVNLSLVTFGQNEVMKKLAGWAAMLAAPTLITSWYGMNFTHMPELTQPWAYPAVIGVVAVVVIGLFIGLKRAKWL